MVDNTEQPESTPEVARLDDVRMRGQRRRNPTSSEAADSKGAVAPDRLGYELTLDLADAVNLPDSAGEPTGEPDLASQDDSSGPDEQEVATATNALGERPSYGGDGPSADEILAAISAEHTQAQLGLRPAAPRGSADLALPDAGPRVQGAAGRRRPRLRHFETDQAHARRRGEKRGERGSSDAPVPGDRRRRRWYFVPLALGLVGVILVTGLLEGLSGDKRPPVRKSAARRHHSAPPRKTQVRTVTEPGTTTASKRTRPSATKSHKRREVSTAPKSAPTLTTASRPTVSSTPVVTRPPALTTASTPTVSSTPVVTRPPALTSTTTHNASSTSTRPTSGSSTAHANQSQSGGLPDVQQTQQQP